MEGHFEVILGSVDRIQKELDELKCWINLQIFESKQQSVNILTGGRQDQDFDQNKVQDQDPLAMADDKSSDCDVKYEFEVSTVYSLPEPAVESVYSNEGHEEEFSENDEEMPSTSHSNSNTNSNTQKYLILPPPEEPHGFEPPSIERRYYTSEKTCKDCGRKFKNGASLRMHIRTVHEGRMHLCPLCKNKKKFLSLDGLQNHIRNWHSNNEAEEAAAANSKKEPEQPVAIHTCDFCEYKNELKANVSRHLVLAHHSCSIYPCTKLRFPSRTEYEKHKRAHH